MYKWSKAQLEEVATQSKLGPFKGTPVLDWCRGSSKYASGRPQAGTALGLCHNASLLAVSINWGLFVGRPCNKISMVLGSTSRLLNLRICFLKLLIYTQRGVQHRSFSVYIQDAVGADSYQHYSHHSYSTVYLKCSST